ncbi:MAG TPA: bifunctional serine/threonine-protein kinase/formylglycine-generating enzyme family protein [Blastocatellia bacterium]|nr:bifunctional serine/threonine-protein kinase/formylglycine-generating enzyme family protein [Blastocatellia bacterium]
MTGSELSEQIARDYNIIQLLGKGGMGDVYLAEQLRVGHRRVALKVLNCSCSENPDLLKRFENEASSAGRINHRNVVMVYESRVTDDGQVYVAMEYVEGRTLRDLIRLRRTLTPREAVEITKQIAAGLGAAHKIGIVHRDVKPDNIMLAKEDDGRLVVKVLDFGIARLTEAGSEGGQTKTGVVMGTPFYMSPEQALGNTGDKIDARSDIYSLAMVVYQMLTGKVAFESDSWMQVMYKHINEAPLAPSRVRPELASLAPIEHVVLKGLEKDREKRQQSITDFARELEVAYLELQSRDPAAAVTALYGSPAPDRAGEFNSGQPPAVPLTKGLEPATIVAPVGQPTPAGQGGQTFQITTPSVEQPVPVEQALPDVPSVPPPVVRKFWSIGRAIVVICAILVLAAAVYFIILSPRAILGTHRDRGTATHRGLKGMPAIHTFAFSVFTVDGTGQIASTHRDQARYFTEDLGGGVTMEMVSIPEGKFAMGAPDADKNLYPDETPQHQVSIRPFYIGRTEVTLGQWAAVAKMPKVNRELDPDTSTFKSDPKLPVQHVTWLDAEEFCERLSRETGQRYRLPSEAEWEYACRAGTVTPFYFGDTITSELVNYDARYPYGEGPQGVARKEPLPTGNLGSPNEFGLYDMHGNQSEWCLDGWHPNYIGAPTDGSEWKAGADQNFRVIRGGSWADGGVGCRSAARNKYGPEIKVSFVGFRVAMASSH